MSVCAKFQLSSSSRSAWKVSVVGGWGGWGLQSHFRVKPNRCVVLGLGFWQKSFLWVSCQMIFGSWSENRGKSNLSNILRWPSFWSLSDLRSNITWFFDVRLRIDTAPIWELKLRLQLLNWMSVWFRWRSYLLVVPVSCIQRCQMFTMKRAGNCCSTSARGAQ